jgi:hypothetical protein
MLTMLINVYGAAIGQSHPKTAYICAHTDVREMRLFVLKSDNIH